MPEWQGLLTGQCGLCGRAAGVSEEIWKGRRRACRPALHRKGEMHVMGISAERVNGFLEVLRQEARDKVDQGSKFEQLVRACLSVSPVYRRQYRKVWHWGEWARQRGLDGRDTGIDLVAERWDGAYCAIQCKFFQAEHALQKGEIASFLAAANERLGADRSIVFSEMMLVSTGGELSANAKTSLANQRVQGIYRTFHQLADGLPEDAKLEELLRTRAHKELWRRVQKQEHKELRPHQQKALKDVLAGFKEHDRGKLIMACGTGKTLLSLKIAERMLRGRGGNVLFLAPSLALISQTLQEWSAQFAPEANFFAVCSDTKVGRESEDISVHELVFPATTDSERLVAQLRPPPPPPPILTPTRTPEYKR